MPTLLAKLKQRVKKLIVAGQQKIAPWCAKSRFASRLYYFIFDSSFAYEQQAILQAQVQYHKQKGIQNDTSALLRRNIHRLEKGLIMKPRKPVFALEYIAETVDVYTRALKIKEFSSAELDWSFSILTEYFAAIAHTNPVISSTFQKFSLLHKRENTQCIPYLYQERIEHEISATQLHQLFQSRRSTRWFNDTDVPRELIEQAVEMSSQAPSACNRQPFKYFVIDKPELRQQIVSLPGGTAGFSQNIQTMIAVVGDLAYYPLARDRHVIYIDAALASMQFMLALETLGLSSCPINWPELHVLDRRVSKLLGLPQYQRVVMFIAVGYGHEEGGIAYSHKKSASELIHYSS